jgi:hypothetical protein
VSRLAGEIHGLRRQASLKSGRAQGADRKGLDDLERRMDVLRKTLKKLEIPPEARGERLKREIQAHSTDLDESIREAWTYSK